MERVRVGYALGTRWARYQRVSASSLSTSGCVWGFALFGWGKNRDLVSFFSFAETVTVTVTVTVNMYGMSGRGR